METLFFLHFAQYPIHVAVPPHSEISFHSTLSKSDFSTETGHINAYNGGSGVEPRLCHPEMSNEASKAPALGLNETSRTPALELDETSKVPALELDETSKAPALGLNETSKAPALRLNETSKVPALEPNETSIAPALGIIETSKAPASGTSHIKESLMELSNVQRSSVSTADTHQQSKPHTHQHKLLTPSQINAAIAASESTRILCSVAAALLVVLSNLGFPGFRSSIMKSITASRPLYLLLLTNLTVVLARLFSGKQGGSTSAGKVQNKAPLENSNDWTDQVSRALGACLLFRKVIDSVFMDFSFYAIVVICGLCLGNLFSS